MRGLQLLRIHNPTRTLRESGTAHSRAESEGVSEMTDSERRSDAISAAEARSAEAVALVASWEMQYVLASRENLHAYVEDLTRAYDAREAILAARNV